MPAREILPVGLAGLALLNFELYGFLEFSWEECLMQLPRTVVAWMVRLVVSVTLPIGFVLPVVTQALQAAGSPGVIDAAREGDFQGVLKLIKDRAGVNLSASDGSTALLWAAFHSDAEMTKALLAAGATVDTANRYGVTPLLQASRNGDVATMQALLNAGADPTRWHAEGETALMAAARTGRLDAVQLLLGQGSFVNAADPFQQETALMWAAAEGHLEVVKALLAAGADANLQAHVSPLTRRVHADHPSGGFTALMFAARNGHEQVVKALMDGGANPKITNADGVTAIGIAILNDRLDLAKELLDLGADPNDGALFFAVDQHDATTDTRAQDATRMQPDHQNKITALGLVKALLDLGADVNKPFVGSTHSTSMCCGPQINSSPFYRAATAADVEVLKLMVAKGAKLDWTPIEVKAQNGQKVAPGLNANVGQTAIYAAMKGGQGPPIQGGPGYTRKGPPPYREPGSREPQEALQVLLRAGANPNAKLPNGSTPMHQAVQAQQVDMIQAIAAAGGSLDAVNKDNQTPLLLAESLKKDAKPAPPANPDAPVGRKKNTPEEVVVALRALMHLDPNDPAPLPPPLAAKAQTPAPKKPQEPTVDAQ
jgi:cytohesin